MPKVTLNVGHFGYVTLCINIQELGHQASDLCIPSLKFGNYFKYKLHRLV